MPLVDWVAGISWPGVAYDDLHHPGRQSPGRNITMELRSHSAQYRLSRSKIIQEGGVSIPKDATLRVAELHAG